jgi:hypothetical protein
VSDLSGLIPRGQSHLWRGMVLPCHFCHDQSSLVGKMAVPRMPRNHGASLDIWQTQRAMRWALRRKMTCSAPRFRTRTHEMFRLEARKAKLLLDY